MILLRCAVLSAVLIRRLAAQGFSPTSSPSVTPNLAPVCDETGACYIGISAPRIFSEAVTACASIGAGWHLASIVDAATGTALTQGSGATCGGAFPAVSPQ